MNSNNTVEQQLAEFKETGRPSTAKRKGYRPVTERVKTFNDALRELGDEHPLVRQWWNFETMTDGSEATCDNADLVAYYKLRIITAALNEGWAPKFQSGEWRYLPFFWLYTKKEYAELSDIQKMSGCQFGDITDDDSNCGFACLVAVDGPSSIDTHFSSRLCYRSEDVARYSGEQFIELWKDYFLI